MAKLKKRKIPKTKTLTWNQLPKELRGYYVLSDNVVKATKTARGIYVLGSGGHRQHWKKCSSGLYERQKPTDNS